LKHRLFLACCLGALVVVQAPADAAFPGDNGKIAYADYHGNFDIYGTNPDGVTGQAQLTSNPADDYEPAWSPDGRKIAFTSFRDGNSEIYVMNADGSGQTRLTNNSADDREPNWTPDGRISFTSGRDGSSEIYVMNTDGNNQTRITNNPASDSQPAWSPDGAKIAFVSDRGAGGTEAIYTMNSDGTGVTELTSPRSGGGFYEAPDWSPDGEKIVFGTGNICYCADAVFAITTMNRDGTGEQVLRSDYSGFRFPELPAWSPDGTLIAYDDAVDAGNLYVFPSDGGCCDSTVAPPNGPGFPRGADWQPLPGPQRSNYKNASQFCKAEREFFGDAAFRQRYGGGANAYGKCVSGS
jgi:Tol biopolymer transport system component